MIKRYWGFSYIALLILFASQIHASENSQERDPWRALQTIERRVPDAGNHSGNVFLEGENVVIVQPSPLPEKAKRWRIVDDKDAVIAHGDLAKEKDASIQAGTLGIGWYRIEWLDEKENCVLWTASAVLAKLKAPIPQDSPVCLDGAHSWFAKNDPEKQAQMSRLAALAGANWIRDRLSWSEMEPEPDRYAEHTTYDDAADIQTRLGLKVLQVFHDSPAWAVEEGSNQGRFPRDLRIVYNFCKTMSERFKHRVMAWEPWNEANIKNFGGHTADEMCSMQKAAYLGFKAGDPQVTVCWNALAGAGTPPFAKNVLENETWPYFDTFNIHSYDWTDAYEPRRQPALIAACGRPIWLSECDRGIQWQSGAPEYDLSRRDEILKAEFIGQSFAESLFAGCQRHFHFILGQYIENKTQFGLLRRDLTPRPSYCALAAVGRFLAGAKCVGKWKNADNPDIHIVAFRSQPDGAERDVLIAWTEKRADWPDRGNAAVDWPLPKTLEIEGIFDYLGRALGKDAPAQLTSAPLFILLPKGEAQKLDLRSPLTSEYRSGCASPIVMQLRMPIPTVTRIEMGPWIHEYEYLIETDKEIVLPLYVYNFSGESAKGAIALKHAPEGWKLTPDHWDVSLEPMGMTRLAARLLKPSRPSNKKSDTWIKWRGDFGEAGKSSLAFRLISAPDEGYEN